jgi:L-ascorbate metabolism protein UlaG (beta-lactamase superfamily)
MRNTRTLRLQNSFADMACAAPPRCYPVAVMENEAPAWVASPRIARQLRRSRAAGEVGGPLPPIGASPQRERREFLEAAHRNRPALRGSFLARWLRAAFRRPRAAVHQPLPAIAPGELGVTFVGHASVLLRYHDTRILTDPNLRRWLFGVRRAWEPGLSAEELAPLDVVLISHAHHDHLVRSTLRRVAHGAVCVVPVQCGDLVEDLGFAQVIELGVGDRTRVGTAEIIAVPALHYGERGLCGGRHRGYGGYIVRGAGPSAYYAGDTAYFSGFAEIGQRFGPEVALLPIGAYAPSSFRSAHMSPLDAVFAFQDLGARLMVPVHFGSFPLSFEPLDEPAAWLRDLMPVHALEGRVQILDNGESHVVAPFDGRPK